MRLADESRAAAASGWGGRLSSGSAPAQVRLWSGTPPSALGQASPDGVLQCAVDLEVPAGSVVGTSYVFTLPRAGVRIASGVITWAELLSGDGVVMVDGTVSLLAGDGDFKIDVDGGLVGSLVSLAAPAEMRF